MLVPYAWHSSAVQAKRGIIKLLELLNIGIAESVKEKPHSFGLAICAVICRLPCFNIGFPELFQTSWMLRLYSVHGCWLPGAHEVALGSPWGRRRPPLCPRKAHVQLQSPTAEEEAGVHALQQPALPPDLATRF